MDFEDIFPILIFAVIVIANILKYNKEVKSDAERTQRRASETMRDIISQSDDEYTVEEYEDEQKEVSVKSEIQRKLEDMAKRIEADLNPRTQQSANVMGQRGKSKFLVSEEGQPSVMNVHKGTSPISPVEEDVYEPVKLNFEDQEELKRAFVYSEILNRKY